MFLAYSLFKKGWSKKDIEDTLNGKQSEKELFLSFALKETQDTAKMFGGE